MDIQNYFKIYFWKKKVVVLLVSIETSVRYIPWSENTYTHSLFYPNRLVNKKWSHG